VLVGELVPDPKEQQDARKREEVARRRMERDPAARSHWADCEKNPARAQMA